VRVCLLPGLKTQQLNKLREALLFYMAQTSRRVSLEYALIDGVNDTTQSLASLLAFCEVPAPGFHVNLLSLNNVEGLMPHASELRRSGGRTCSWFERALMNAGISVSRRVSKGESIAAACGQLAFK